MAEVTTSGSGTSEFDPDRATLSVEFAETGRDRVSATRALTKAVGAAERALDRPEVQVTSRRFGVNTNFDGGRWATARASQFYRVTVTDLSVLEDLLGELIRAEPCHLGGPFWELADRTAVRREVQRLAVLDAQEKAAGLAAALGRGLGELVRIGEPDTGGGFAYGYGGPGGVGRAATPELDISALRLEPEQVEVSASCTATWLLD